MQNNKQKVALVTGASSGIGQAVAQTLAKNDYIVYGTSRRAAYETVSCDGASYVMAPLTLEDDTSIRQTVAYVLEKHGRIDLLVNAAGSGIAGAVEETTAEEAQRQFDVCLFGVIRVMGQVLPAMRAAKSGMVINIGSMAACIPIAFQGMYSAVKAALFTMTAAMRLELKPFGVTCCTVEPGDTKTGFVRTFSKMSAKTAYRVPLERALYEMIRSEMSSPGPQQCAKTVLKIARMKRPPVRVSVGAGYKIFYVISRLCPWPLKERLLSFVYLRKDPPKDAVWTFDKQFGED